MNMLNTATVELVEQIVNDTVNNAISGINATEDYKGEFDTLQILETAYPAGKINWWAYNIESGTNYTWNSVLSEWVQKVMTYNEYKALRTANLPASKGASYGVTAN